MTAPGAYVERLPDATDQTRTLVESALGSGGALPDVYPRASEECFRWLEHMNQR
jgi:hypothetical protein